MLEGIGLGGSYSESPSHQLGGSCLGQGDRTGWLMVWASLPSPGQMADGLKHPPNAWTEWSYPLLLPKTGHGQDDPSHSLQTEGQTCLKTLPSLGLRNTYVVGRPLIMVFSHWVTTRTRMIAITRMIIMGSTIICRALNTAPRQIPTRIPIEFCTLAIGLCIGLILGVAQCEYTINVFTLLCTYPMVCNY